MNSTLTRGAGILAVTAGATVVVRRRSAPPRVDARDLTGKTAVVTGAGSGIGHAGAVVDTTLEDWRRPIDVNIMGVVHGLHAFLPAHIVNTASMAGLVPAAGPAIVSTSTMRGEWAQRQARTVELYAKRGASPDIVARQTLAAITRGRRIVPTPRYQVVPHWLLGRVFPPAGRALSLASYRFLRRNP